MAKTQLWQLVVLLFAFVACSKCSMCSRRLECPMSGASFGGRLVLRNDGGSNSAMFSRLIGRGRKIIFQALPAHLRHPMGSGRGQIWIGRRNCQRSGSEPGYCPWTGDRPCLDKGIPCETEPPSYSQSHPLQFPEVTGDSIKVSWPAWDETIDSGVGPVTGYKIWCGTTVENMIEEIPLDRYTFSHRFYNLQSRTTYYFNIVLVRDEEPIEGQPSLMQNATTECGELTDVNLAFDMGLQNTTGKFNMTVSWQLPSVTRDCEVTYQELTKHQLDKDNCKFIDSPVGYQIDLERRSRRFPELPPNTRYNITLLVRNPVGTIVTSQVAQTPRTEPGVPGGIQVIPAQREKPKKIEFKWVRLPCGERNGQILRYEYTGFVAQTPINGTKPGGKRPRYTHNIELSVGDTWSFQVRACNEAGCGQYAQKKGTY